MKSLMLSVLQEVLADAGTWCDISTTRDYETVSRRVEDEGVSFLTITLTDFCKDLEKALDRGFVDHSLFKGFAFREGLPRFLGGFLDLIFDRCTGRLLDSPSTVAIQSVRQITLFYGKVGLDCTPERDRAAIDKYVQCEQEVRRADKLLTLSDLDEFKYVGFRVFGQLLSLIDLLVHEGKIIPRHGPGATADGLKGNRKFYQNEWPIRLEENFPSGAFLFTRWGLNDPDNVTFLEPGAERPVKVITVPKTLKTPRIIAVEPTCMQYAQQAVMEVIYDQVKNNVFYSRIIGFQDQVPNQLLAKKGSSDRSLATLDLSEASDRVSNQHVLALLAGYPHFNGAVQSSRSRKADVPGHGVIRLAKFASMGSALCFPLEAIVFATVVFVGIERALKRQLTAKEISSLSRSVRVYGDDIVVPTRFVTSVVDTLEAFGFKVGLHKSFWTGKFRESCGKEYYDGEDVTVTRCRKLFPTRQTDVKELVSTVSLRNQLYQAGYWRTVRYLDRMIEDIIPFPAVGPDSPALGRFSFLGYENQKTDPYLQLPMVKAARVRYHLPTNRIDGYQALLKYFLKRGDEPLSMEHLERSGRPYRATIKVKWIRSY
jgi:hypothetical protein